MISGGNFNFLEAFPSLVEFVVVMGITLLMGRWFCGWLCAFGAYNDLIYFLSKKIFKSKFKINEKVDNILKYVKYIVLIFIVIVSWTMGLDLYKVNGARGGECINCLKCTEVCPRNNANVNILGQDVNQNLAGSVAMATMLGVYGITNFGANTLTNSGIISKQSTSV